MEELSAGRPLLGLHWSCSLHVVGAIVYCVGLEVKIPRPVPRQLYCSCCTLLLRAACHASLREQLGKGSLMEGIKEKIRM